MLQLVITRPNEACLDSPFQCCTCALHQAGTRPAGRFYQRKDIIDAVTPDKRGEIASVRLGGSEDAHRLFWGGALMPPVEMTSCILYLALVVFGIPKDHFLSFHFPSVNITPHTLTIIGCFKRSWHSFTVYIHYYVCMLVTKTLIYICN